MNIIFTNLAWIGLTALVVIPILVHLFARSKPPSYKFSDNKFLRRIIKKTARFQKPQDLLILILRSLAVLAILLAFLQPLLVSDRNEDEIGAKSAIVFVLDRSASMSAKEGAVSRFDQGVRTVTSILNESDFDLINVVWLDSEPDSVFPELGKNMDFITKSLNEASASYENGDVRRAVEMAVEQVEAASGSKRIVIISDFQKANWSNLDINVPKGISLETLSVSDSDINNTAVTALHTIPVQPIIGESVDIITQVSNYSAEDRRVKVFIDSGGGRSTKEVDIPAWSSSEVMHQVEFSKSGEVVLSAKVEQDDFPKDDTFFNKLNVRDRLKLAVMGAEVPDALFRLGQSLPWLEVVTTSEVEVAKLHDFVFINEWKGDTPEEWKALAEFGVSTFMTLGKGTEAEGLAELLGVSDPGSLAVQDKKEGWPVVLNGSDYSAVQIFRNGEYGVPGDGSHLVRLALAKELLPDQVLLSFSDGVPAWIRKPVGSGSLNVMNLSLDEELSDWTERASFVSFMAEMLLAERKKSSAEAYSYPGNPVGYYPQGGLDKHSVSLYENDSKLSFTESQTSQGLQLVSSSISSPGVYNWKAGGNTVKSSVVNMVNTESDLRIMNADDLSIGDAVTKSQLLRRASLGDGFSLWPLCIAAAVLFLMLELIVATFKPKVKEVSL